ncbi:hypothetical protein PAAG_01949 [Paracoccidioides lutzii Pb01]|uniref:Uncharacterized protein n=1 Tax=Paracoccidioides lutzii (strain ATCC MYA-826 / Pb01) TaxID=502779 RepID=C1GTV4_PARBA|nr:hypothetical protein PAAG_01949 [Paracoccidioides lutzii Pb01]EEH39760.2 hypothetical protein PAAG_01949 [Paracoccidioides lutzii Pb01]
MGVSILLRDSPATPLSKQRAGEQDSNYNTLKQKRRVSWVMYNITRMETIRAKIEVLSALLINWRQLACSHRKTKLALFNWGIGTALEALQYAALLWENTDCSSPAILRSKSGQSVTFSKPHRSVENFLDLASTGARDHGGNDQIVEEHDAFAAAA